MEYLSVPMEFRQVCAESDGRILDGHRWRRAFRCKLRASGLKEVRLHDLRHIHASLMLLDGVPMHVVSKRLGHASIQTTIDQYGHRLPSTDADAASQFAGLLRMES